MLPCAPLTGSLLSSAFEVGALPRDGAGRGGPAQDPTQSKEVSALYDLIRNGTNSGWKRVQERARDWRCPGCGAYLRYWWLNCPTCSTRRPEQD